MKIIEVHSCIGCPNVRWDNFSQAFVCAETGFLLADTSNELQAFQVPDETCTLTDAVEYALEDRPTIMFSDLWKARDLLASLADPETQADPAAARDVLPKLDAALDGAIKGLAAARASVAALDEALEELARRAAKIEELEERLAEQEGKTGADDIPTAQHDARAFRDHDAPWYLVVEDSEARRDIFRQIFPNANFHFTSSPIEAVDRLEEHYDTVFLDYDLELERAKTNDQMDILRALPESWKTTSVPVAEALAKLPEDCRPRVVIHSLNEEDGGAKCLQEILPWAERIPFGTGELSIRRLYDRRT